MKRPHPVVPALLGALLAAVAAAAPTPAAAASGPIAAGGFGRPVQLDVVPGGGDVRIGVAASSAGAAAVWEDEEGLVLRPVGAAEGGERRLLDSHGIRDLAAGSAGGEAVVAWSERDLRTGRTRVSWRWGGETREVLQSGQPPLLRLVRGGERPELLVARPEREGWRLSLHAWDGTVRAMAPRPLTVAGLDAVRTAGAVVAAWLEGSDELVLGTVERDWSAWLARWPDGADAPDAPVELGDAVRIGSGDAVRLAVVDGEVHAMWPDAEGELRVTGPGGAREDLGRGVPLGRLGGAWTWVEEDRVLQLSGADGAVRQVLLLPATPERIEGADVNDTSVLAWSSGRYRGGLEVWAVDDREAYRASPIERLAARMGWDPWSPWTSAAGHALLSVLTAVLLAAALTPLWWVGTALLGRRDGVSPATAALEGATVAVGTVLVLVALAASRATLSDAEIRALLGGPLVLGVAAILGVAVAWAVLRRQDLEPSFGRLASAWIAGGTMLLVMALVTAQAWQDAFGPVL